MFQKTPEYFRFYHENTKLPLICAAQDRTEKKRVLYAYFSFVLMSTFHKYVLNEKDLDITCKQNQSEKLFTMRIATYKTATLDLQILL